MYDTVDTPIHYTCILPCRDSAAAALELNQSGLSVNGQDHESAALFVSRYFMA